MGVLVKNDKTVELRRRMVEDHIYRGLDWRQIKERYGTCYGKTSFYKYKKRYQALGVRGLNNRVRKEPVMTHGLTFDQKMKILEYVYERPSHGPARIADNIGFKISGKAIWRYLCQKNLNSKRKRRYWAHDQGNPILNEKEKAMRRAKFHHIKSTRPGELVQVDTFCISLRNLGRLWQYTACDTFSSFGWAKIYLTRDSNNAVGFIFDHVLKAMPEGKIKRILTDRGLEFHSHRSFKEAPYFTTALAAAGIKHSVTKIAHPWTNGYVERIQQTIWQEFYLDRLRREFPSLDELNQKLQEFMLEYNFKRKHKGYKLRALGLAYPAHAFFDVKEHSCKIRRLKIK